MKPRDWLAAVTRTARHWAPPAWQAVRHPDRRWFVIAAVFALLLLNFEFTAHYVNSSQAAFTHQQQEQRAAAARLAAAAKAAQLRQSRGICEALVGLDDARIGAVFASPSHTGVPLPESYGYRLAQHIHAVVQATHCPQLLAGKDKP